MRHRKPPLSRPPCRLLQRTQPGHRRHLASLLSRRLLCAHLPHPVSPLLLQHSHRRHQASPWPLRSRRLLRANRGRRHALPPPRVPFRPFRRLESLSADWKLRNPSSRLPPRSRPPLQESLLPHSRPPLQESLPPRSHPLRLGSRPPPPPPPPYSHLHRAAVPIRPHQSRRRRQRACTRGSPPRLSSLLLPSRRRRAGSQAARSRTSSPPSSPPGRRHPAPGGTPRRRPAPRRLQWTRARARGHDRSS